MARGPFPVVLRRLRRLIGRESAGDLTDGQLLERFRVRRDEAAFAALVARHGPMVLGLCRRLLGREHDAEDAFQATFLVLVRKAGSIRRRDSVGGWLYEVAYHLALRARAEAARRRAHERQVAAMPPANPPADADRHELRAVLDEELKRLPEKYRTPLVLCYLEGRTNEEAAQELGRPPGSMSWLLARGRELLRRRLARRGVTLSAGALGTALAADATAAVPEPLAAATLRTAVAGAAAAAPVAALVDGMVHQMFLTRLKLAAAVVLLAGAVGAGAGVIRAWSGRGSPAVQAADGAAGAKPGPTADEDGSPPAKAETPKDKRPDPDEKPLPPRAVARLGTPPMGHTSRVSAVAFSPTGETLASAGDGKDPTIRLWDVATGKERLKLPFLEGTNLLAFSPDGKMLAAVSGSGADKTVHLWDVPTGKEIRRWADKGGVIWSLAFSPDGKTLATGGDGGPVKLWEVATGKERERPAIQSEPQSSVHQLAFSPDGQVLAYAVGTLGRDNDTVGLWSLAKGAELRRLQPPSQAVLVLAFSPDGQTLATGGFSTSGRKEANAVCLWDVATGKEGHRLEGHEGPVRAVAFFKGKALLSAGADTTVRAWTVADGKGNVRLGKMHPDITLTNAIAFSPDGMFMAVGGIQSREISKNFLCLRDTATGRVLYRLQGHAGPVQAVAFAPGGKTLASGTLSSTILWDVAKSEEIRSFPVEDSRVLSLAFAPDGKTLASGDSGKQVFVWDVAAGKKLPALAGHTADVTLLAFAPDGKALLSAGSDRQTYLWDVAKGKELWKVTRLQGPTLAAAFSPDGKVVTTAHADGMLVRDDEVTTEQVRLAGFGGPATLAAFSPDSRILATFRPGGPVCLWEVAPGLELRRLPSLGNKAEVRALAFSPDGQVLALGRADGTVWLWDPAADTELLQLAGHEGAVLSLAFSPDGKRLASGSADATVLVWDVAGVHAPQPPAKDLKPDELNALWKDLADDEDAATAWRAVQALAAAKEPAVAFLKERLAPAARARERERLQQLIKQLDADDLAAREAAARELKVRGAVAKVPLRAALAAKPSLELRRRLEDVLAALRPPSRDPQAPPGPLPADLLRALRAVRVLEQVGTKEARDVLASLADKSAPARQRQEARAALARLARKQ